MTHDEQQVADLVERVTNPPDRRRPVKAPPPRAGWLWLSSAGVTLVLLVVTVLALVMALRDAQRDLASLRRSVDANSAQRTAQLDGLMAQLDGLRTDVRARDQVILRLVEALREAGVDPGPILAPPALGTAPSGLDVVPRASSSTRPASAPRGRPDPTPGASSAPPPSSSPSPSPRPSPSPTCLQVLVLSACLEG